MMDLKRRFTPFWIAQKAFHYFGTLNMGKKVFVLTLIVEMAVVSILGTTTYRIWKNNFVDRELENAQDNTARAAQYINAQIGNIQGQMIALSENIGLLSESDQVVEQLIQRHYEMHQPFVEAIYILKRPGDVIGVPNVVFEIYGKRLFRFFYEELSERNRLFSWSEPYQSSLFGNTMTGVRNIEAASEWDDALIAVDLNLKALLRSSMDYQKYREYDLFLINKGQVVSSYRDNGVIRYDVLAAKYVVEPRLQRLLEDEYWTVNRYTDDSGKTYRLFRSGLYRFNVSLVMAVDESRIYGSLRKLQVNFAIIGLLGFALCFGVAYIVMRNLARPVQLFIHKMKCEDGQMRAMIRYVDRKDEIGDLARTYNEMMRRISSQVKTIMELEAQKRITEMKALQSQIRPHFLYNTLNAIKSMANLKNVPSVAYAVASLITLLRYTVDKQDEFVTLEEELNHLRAYIRLMRFQYPEIERVRWDIDKRLLAAYVPKLILQPLVENAIFHGILPKEGTGALEIVACGTEKGMMSVEIRDDGVGIPPDRLERIVSVASFDVEAEGSIGLANVCKRLRLHFAQQCPETNLRIFSVEGKGTTVVLTMPVYSPPVQKRNQDADI